MKYTTRVEIELLRERVVELYCDPAHYSAWQESLVSQELLQGEPGQVGAQTRLQHKMGKREIEMRETITRRELPDLHVATYTAKGVYNEAVNHFEALDEGHTAWTMDTEFRCSGMMWVLTTFAPGMFKKTTQVTMEAFKAFAERQTD